MNNSIYLAGICSKMHTNAGSWVWDIFPLEILDIVSIFSCFQLSLKLLPQRYHYKKTEKKKSNQVGYLLNLRRCLKRYRSSVRKLILEIKKKSSEWNCIHHLYNFENCIVNIRSDIVWIQSLLWIFSENL